MIAAEREVCLVRMSNLTVFRGGGTVASSGLGGGGREAGGVRWFAPVTLRPLVLAALVWLVGTSIGTGIGLIPAAWAEHRSPEDVHVKTPVYHIKHSAFRAGERWMFEFRWSGIPVGRFAIELTEGDGGAGKRLNIDVTGRTNSFIDLLWRYRLHAQGWVLTEPFAPGRFHSEEHENSRFKTTDVRFDADRRIHAVRKKGDNVSTAEFAAPNTYDILSAVFMVMSLDHHLGDEYFVDVLTGMARYLVTIKVEERGSVEVEGKPVDAFRLSLRSYDLTDPEKSSKHRGTSLWVSASKPKRLLKAESKTFVGSIYGRLAAVQSIPSKEPAKSSPEPVANSAADAAESAAADVPAKADPAEAP